MFNKSTRKFRNPVYRNNAYDNTLQESLCFNSILNAMVNPVACRDKNGQYLFVNEAFEKLVGLPAKEIIGYTWIEICKKIYGKPRGRNNIKENCFQQASGEWDEINVDTLRSGDTRTIKQEIRCADGIKRTFLVNFSAFSNEDGEVQGLVTVLQDITELRKSEKTLENDEKYRIITEQTGQLVYDFDLLTDKGSWAGAIEKVTGYSKAEFQSMSRDLWVENIHPADRESVLREFTGTRRTGKSYHLEFRFRKKDGTCIYLENNGIYLTDRSGKPVRALGAMKDITERKLAEETLAKTEMARKREVHHRIKNNLQVISSLLDLQAENLENERIKEILRESQNRIISIALIHRELYRDREMDNVNFSTYIRELAENLLDTYKVGDSKISLCVDLEENILFDVETVVPLGIIINEIFSNSLKYAFPDNVSGEIRISLERKKAEKSGYSNLNEIENRILGRDTKFILTVSDNGVGIPKNFNIGTADTLGLQLIHVLVEQLDGSVRLNRNRGTEFVIEFAVRGYGK